MARYYLIAGVLAALLLAAGPALAAGKGVGPGDGSGPIHSFEEAEYTGVVDQYLEGMGMTLCKALSDCITVYGVGPVSYWESVGVDRPAVGEEVTVTYYARTYDEESRNIATSITVGEDIVYLRDEDGTPLWR
ncbi:MAG: hypothetical protein IH608_03650 [Proteobacteria bacterium]|nr:hypothetical protein [Pseudomonadota bacterium]